MKYLKQFLIILVISFIGEVLKALLPLPVPASIYGMVILFVCLVTGVIRLDAVKETGRFLIEIMPVMFIPAGVGLMSSWGVLSGRRDGCGAGGSHGCYGQGVAGSHPEKGQKMTSNCKDGK